MLPATTTTSTSRVSRGSEREESYASPKYPHVAETGSDCRRRRNHSSSSDKGNIIESDGFSDEDFRVGGPYLCALPDKSTHDHFIPNGDTRIALLQEVIDILATAGIRWVDLAFCGHISVYDPEPIRTPTLYIESPRTSIDSNWISTAREIHGFFIRNGVSDISIEMADDRAFQPITLSPVRDTSPIFACWDRVAADILQQSDICEWTTLGCYEITAATEENEVTVLVTVDPSVNKDWRGVRDHIVKIIDGYNLFSVAVRIVKDRVLRGGMSAFGYPCPELPLSALSAPPQVGQSIGIRGIDTAGTFGGWVQLQDCNGEWEQFGITCSHCVLPPDGKMVAECLEVQQPTDMDLSKGQQEWDSLVDIVASRLRDLKWRKISIKIPIRF